MASPTSTPDAATSTSDAERSELERLRAEVAELRTKTSRGRRAGRTGRWVGAVALLVVAALLMAVAGLAVFVRNQLLDTDRYVATVAPLSSDPTIQTAVANRLTNEIVTRVDLNTLVANGLAAVERLGVPPQIGQLAGPISSGLTSFLGSEVNKVVASDAFDQAWIAANRAAHGELAAVLTGQQGQFTTTTDTSVSLDLGAFLGVVKQRLVASGFALAANIPEVPVQFTLFESSDLPRIRNAVTALDTVATWLPWVALVLLIGGILAAPNRRRGLMTAALMVAGVFVLLLAGLAIGRTIYLNNLPSGVQSVAAAQVLYDTVLRFLVAGATTILVLALVIAVIAFMAGPSGFARGTREFTGRGLDSVGGALGRSGVPLGPVPSFLAKYRLPIEIAIVVIAAVVLLTWDRPDIPVVLGVTLVTLLVLGLLEILIRSAPHADKDVPAAAPQGAGASAG